MLGEGSEAEKPITEVVDLTTPPSGMILSPPFSFYVVSSVGSEISLNDINMLPRSPSLLIKKSPSLNLVNCFPQNIGSIPDPSRNLVYSLPQNIGSIPDPLVASCTSEENSIRGNFLVYSRRCRAAQTNS